MRPHISFARGLTGLAFMLSLALPVFARPWIYEPDNVVEARAFTRQMDERYDRRGLFVEMRDAYLAEARAKQGTSRGGGLLVAAANYTVVRLNDLEAARPLFLEAARIYEGSMIAMGARSNLANWDRWETKDTASYIATMSQISVDVGGPSVDEVLAASDTTALAARVRSLHPERQLGVWNVFKNVYYAMSKDDPEKAFKIAKFGRSALEPGALTGNGDFSRILIREFDKRYNPSGAIGSLASTPNVSVLSPSPGGTVAPNPTLSVRATTGDYHNTPVDLTRMEFEVDGVDRRFEVIVKSDLDLSFQEGRDFEVLTLSLPTSLQPGQHTVKVKVARASVSGDPPEGPEAVEESWSFTVSDNPPPPPPTDQTLNVSKDSILSQQNPHRNEGANDLLQLSHRPEEVNKSNNPIIAFNLANVNLTGLRKARLVLNIQECEQPKKWGPEGRKILAYPVNQQWVEGNGETIKAGQEEKTRGSGQGVTWFSPIDDNIANKVPNGALQWSGARPFLGPLTAAPVLIVNKQVGTIEFDVTQDVKSGFTDGWLVRKQDEAAFGNVRFYSKEGAASNQALAPKLILEYNGPTAQAPSRSLLSIVLQLVEQGYRQLQADRDAPGSGLSWLGRWWPAWLQA